MRRPPHWGELVRRLAASGAALLARLSTKPALIGLFLFCAAPAGIFMAVLTPPGQVPDEPAHMARAAGLLHGAVLATRRVIGPPGHLIPSAGLMVDVGLMEAALGHVSIIDGSPKVTLPDEMAIRSAPAWHVRSWAHVPNTATYFPAVYLPASAGLALGLALHAPPFICLLLARIFMLDAFLALGCATLWVADFGQPLLLAVLLLPMTLFLAGSLNEDGVLVGVVCLATAAFTRGLAGSRKHTLLGLGLLVLFLGSKPPYLPLLGLGLLPLFNPGLPRRLGAVLLACLPVFAWVALVVRSVVVPFIKPPYHPGPLFSGDRSALLDQADPAANLHILLAQPSLFITLPWHSLTDQGMQKLREMIGVLGLLQIQFPDNIYWCWLAALVVALLGAVAAGRPTPALALRGVATAGYVLLLLAVTYWALMLSMYLNYTEVGDGYIDGMQGRYILPLLPFSVAGRSGWQSRPGRPALLPAIVAVLPAAALALFDLAYLPMRIVSFYYVR